MFWGSQVQMHHPKLTWISEEKDYFFHFFLCQWHYLSRSIWVTLIFFFDYWRILIFINHITCWASDFTYFILIFLEISFNFPLSGSSPIRCCRKLRDSWGTALLSFIIPKVLYSFWVVIHVRKLRIFGCTYFMSFVKEIVWCQEAIL